jgi:antitoxin component of MazEF toxin-antitoxin module
MVQKLLKVGSSAAVTIPKKSLGELGWDIGDELIVDVDQIKQSVTVKSRKQPHTQVVNRELIEWTDKFIEEYRPALEALAKK